MKGEILDLETVKRIVFLENENARLKEELKTAQGLINGYYRKNKHDINKYIIERKELSEGAKRFVRDIVDGVI